ncbi:S ribonuclease [Pyrus ussuriensis x Pyrus communis]|uniref:S ribonuclease n=1 Tax=Pyrus ussuriensis x Pyrus communis TaxID=2448454 RepID=A0A5N5F3F6_9ROSA|nr:S ribonuclease [Pyrus ussuriensis x Pyrus communis]
MLDGLDGLAIFQEVKREGLDGLKSQRAGDDFHEWAIFKVCMLEVIDHLYKRRGDTITDSELKRHHSSKPDFPA